MLLPSDVHPDIQALHAYWERKRAGRSMPSRANIDLTDVARLMSQIFIADAETDA